MISKEQIREWLEGRPIQYMNAASNHVRLEDLIHDCIQDLVLAGEWVSVDYITLNDVESMKLHDAYEILRIHQKWRKGDQYLKQIPPYTLSEAIDMILNAHYSAEMPLPPIKEGEE